MSDKEQQELALALERLRGEVAKNNEAMRMGFAALDQQVKAAVRGMGEHQVRCRNCETALRTEIMASEQRTLARESELVGRFTEGMEKLESRVRSLEVSRGWAAGVIGLVSALIGAVGGTMINRLVG